MAAQAAEVFAYGKNSWQIGPEIFKAGDGALRYMDYPTKDCGIYGKPGVNCSIRHVKQYQDGDPAHGKQPTDVHYSSGVYNRVFYLLGTSDGWNVRKAFDVMVEANRHYWTSQTTFASGACGVLKATKVLGYDKMAVKIAFADVGISAEQC
jgi:Zn-dependent metalloprotease